MTQNFNFDVNIEKRMPTTGKVFMVDRMTSDYALAHPFDVDGFLEETYQKWADCEIIGFRETREALRNQWIKTLSVTRPSGDASIYPNNNGAHHPALMEVWMKAGDYWRAGFRMGDLLPAFVPGHKITRLGNGEWICLFPKDMGLLSTAAVNHGDCPTDSSEAEIEGTVPCDSAEQNDAPEYSESAKSKPVELDMFAQMKMELDQLREENERLRCNMTQNERAAACSPMTREGQEPSDIEDSHRCSSPCVSQPRPRRVRRQKQDVMQLYSTPAITVAHSDDDHSERNKKIFAAVATAVVFVVLVNTVGLFGIAALGLLAGGLVK